MILNFFPIEGSLRESLIIIEGIIIFLFLEQAVILYVRNKNEKLNALKSLQERAYMWLFFGYGCMWIFVVIADFYVYTPFLRILILNIGFLIEILCVLIFIKLLERNIIFVRKFIFTNIYSIFVIIYVLFIVFAIDFAAYISSVFWIIFLTFFTLYFKDLASRFHLNEDLKDLKIKILVFYIGFLITFIGYQLTTRFLINIFGLTIRFLGDILQILGFVMLSWFFLTVPSISEYYWREELQSIFVVHKSGLLIFEKHFGKNIKPINESIISGTLTMIKMMLDEFNDHDEKAIIEKEGNVIIIQPKKFIYGIAICKEDLKSIHILLNKFIEKIEMIYYDILEKWDGNLRILRPIEEIANDTFYNM